MRSTRLIETKAGEFLFSPVMAHSVEPGDLVALDVPELDPWGPTVARVGQVRPLDGELFLWLTKFADGKKLGPESRGLNTPILRAVGARVCGLPGGR